MSDFVIDAHAWIEYFNGTKLGVKVKEIVENKNNTIFTNIVTIAELASSYERNSLNFENEEKILRALSKIYFVDFNFAKEAGKLHAVVKKERRNISLADVFVLFTARKLGAKVVTGDDDFKGFKEAIVIK